jgi:hypothetical protein
MLTTALPHHHTAQQLQVLLQLPPKAMPWQRLA